MTGAKVLRIADFYDEDVEYTAPDSSNSFFTSRFRGLPRGARGPRLPRLTPPPPILLAELYYRHQIRVVRELRSVYLASPQQGTLWFEPRLAAKMNARRIQTGNGIHAYRSLMAAVRANEDPDHQPDHPGRRAAYAIVRAEGKIAVGEFGWIAEAATIVRIFLMPADYVRFCRELYDRYRVPVEVLPRSLRQPAPPAAERRLRDPQWHRYFSVWNRRYGPESRAQLWRWEEARSPLFLYVPEVVRHPSDIAIWNPQVAAWSALRWAARLLMRSKDWGQLGGLARAKAFREGKVALSGSAVAHPTACRRCGEVLPSARQAWRHCRTGKPGRPKKA